MENVLKGNIWVKTEFVLTFARQYTTILSHLFPEDLAGTSPFAPPEDGAKGSNTNDNTLPGSPFDMLRAVSSVERPRP
jgi:hypothetical protein